MDNVARVRGAFRAFAERDSITVGRLIGNGVVWRVPGRSAMAGEYRGRAEIFEFLRRTAELTGGTYRTDLVDVWGGDELVVALYRAVGSRDGRELDIPQTLVFRFDGEELQEVLAVPGDPAAFDAFWGCETGIEISADDSPEGQGRPRSQRANAASGTRREPRLAGDGGAGGHSLFTRACAPMGLG